MTPEEVLIKIMTDASNFDQSKLDHLSKKKKDIEVEKIVQRWLGWISSVNQPVWDTGCTYEDGNYGDKD